MDWGSSRLVVLSTYSSGADPEGLGVEELSDPLLAIGPYNELAETVSTGFLFGALEIDPGNRARSPPDPSTPEVLSPGLCETLPGDLKADATLWGTYVQHFLVLAETWINVPSDRCVQDAALLGIEGHEVLALLRSGGKKAFVIGDSGGRIKRRKDPP